MDDVDNARRRKRALTLGGLTILIVFLFGAAAGFTKAVLDQEGAFRPVTGAILAVFVLLTIGCGWLLWRTARAPTGEAPPTRKERLNRNILIACGALGFLSAFAMMFVADEELLAAGMLSDAPLPPALAALMLVLLCVLLPILSWIWHRRAVDELEVAAYKDGALRGLNVFMIGAPAWWIAWRGGFVPEPDGVAIYFATIAVMGAVWIWKKYR